VQAAEKLRPSGPCRERGSSSAACIPHQEGLPALAVAATLLTLTVITTVSAIPLMPSITASSTAGSGWV
jgi:hypothetical protein